MPEMLNMFVAFTWAAWIFAAWGFFRTIGAAVGLVIELKQLKDRKRQEALAEEFIKKMSTSKPEAGKHSFVMPGYDEGETGH